MKVQTSDFFVLKIIQKILEKTGNVLKKKLAKILQLIYHIVRVKHIRLI